MKYQGITIQKRKNCNTWYARYRNNGKQFSVSDRTQQGCYNKLKQALRIKNKTHNEINNQSITFLAWYNKWFDTYKKDKIKQTTLLDYNSSMKYLKKIYNTEINQITNMEIVQILNEIPYERRKQKVYELLKDILNRAAINGLISKSPIIDSKPKHKRKETEALSIEDQNKFEQFCQNPKYKIFIIILLQGLRKGEALALTKSDFDLNSKTLKISKSLNTFNKIDTTKNEYSNRIMPLFNKTIQIIKPILESKQENERLFDFSQKTCDTLFQNLKDENKLNQEYMIKSLRKTFISNAKDMGVPEHIIQAWVGHNIGSSVTSRNYTQVRDKAELKYFNILNATELYSDYTQEK